MMRLLAVTARNPNPNPNPDPNPNPNQGAPVDETNANVTRVWACETAEACLGGANSPAINH